MPTKQTKDGTLTQTMIQPVKRSYATTFIVVFILGMGLYLLLSRSLYFNIYTHSLPFGIYIKTTGTPTVGEYAASCLTQEIADYGRNRGYLGKGFCNTGIVPVLKVIKGTPGAVYKVNDGLFNVNNDLGYPLSQKDSLGRPLKRFYKENSVILKPGEYLLLSNYVQNSWDSRYWGPVQIQFLLKPLFVWNK